MFWARGDGTDGLFVVPSAGGGARKVAHGLFVACWSPDGSTIALALFVAGKILFLNRLGEEQRSITLQGTHGWIWDLDWSPVHGELLFVANDDQQRAAVWTIQPDGSEQTKLFAADTEIPAARWAPEGDALYYFDRVNQTVSLNKVFVAPDSRTVEHAARPLISGLESDGSFGLSADGNRLVYARAPYYSNLWLVEAVDSESGRQISTNTTDSRYFGHREAARVTRWQINCLQPGLRIASESLHHPCDRRNSKATDVSQCV